MFQRLFRHDRETNRAVTEGLYAGIVAAARQPALYAQWGVADTPLGRFEMITLHMVLTLRRMRGEAALRDIAQEITDHFFLEVDHSLRELGIGDVGVPKRMKRLAKMFYGRAAAYSQALDGNDLVAMAAALSRDVWPAGAGKAEPVALATYSLRAASLLGDQTVENLRAGRIIFPAADRLDSIP